MNEKVLGELIAKWNAEADAFGQYNRKIAKRECARELAAALAEKPAERPADEQVICVKLDAVCAHLNHPNQIQSTDVMTAVKLVEDAAEWARMHIERRGKENDELRAERPQLSAERVRNFFDRHAPVLWEDRWTCRCSRWSLSRKLNGVDQADKSRAEHLTEEFMQEFAALLTGVPPTEEQFKAIAKELGDNGYCSYIAVEEVLRKHLTAPAAPPVPQASALSDLISQMKSYADRHNLTEDDFLYVVGLLRQAQLCGERAAFEKAAQFMEERGWKASAMEIRALADSPVSGRQKD